MTERRGNWGRWGLGDERGAANLLDEGVVRAAAAHVRRGIVFSLAVPIAQNMPSAGTRPAPQHFMTLDGADYCAGVSFANGSYQAADDHISIPCHTGTHIDALAHVWYDHELYNGHPESAVRSYGATRCGIQNLTHVVTSGVLVDVAAAVGVASLDDGHEITLDEFLAAPAAAAVGRGSAVLVRTGWHRRLRDAEVADSTCSPGIGLDVAAWLAARDVTLVGSDNIAVEATAGNHRYGGGRRAPECHKLLIRDHGIYLLELLWLEELAAASVTEFLFTLAPLPIVGGTASPVNPLAVT